MVTANNSETLVTCDNAAMLQIFDLSAFKQKDIASLNQIEPENLHQYVKRLNVWCTGHQGGITSIDYLESRKLILTAGHDGEIILWTDDGRKIGMFGQMAYCHHGAGKDPVPKIWNLNDANTFVDKESRSDTELISDEPETADHPKRKSKAISKEEKEAQHLMAHDQKDDDDHDADVGAKENNEDFEVRISDDTWNLLHNNTAMDSNANENDVLLSSPELHAILQKPAGSYMRSRKRNQLKGIVTRQLKTFELDEIPKESPFK